MITTERTTIRRMAVELERSRTCDGTEFAVVPGVPDTARILEELFDHDYKRQVALGNSNAPLVTPFTVEVPGELEADDFAANLGKEVLARYLSSTLLVDTQAATEDLLAVEQAVFAIRAYEQRSPYGIVLALTTPDVSLPAATELTRPLHEYMRTASLPTAYLPCIYPDAVLEDMASAAHVTVAT